MKKSKLALSRYITMITPEVQHAIVAEIPWRTDIMNYKIAVHPDGTCNCNTYAKFINLSALQIFGIADKIQDTTATWHDVAKFVLAHELLHAAYQDDENATEEFINDQVIKILRAHGLLFPRAIGPLRNVFEFG